MKTLFTVGSLLMSMNVQAALGPYADSVKQIETVLRSSQLSDELQGDSVNSVKATGDLEYLVSTSECRATVRLKTRDTGRRVGPIEYSVKEIVDVVCEKSLE